MKRLPGLLLGFSALAPLALVAAWRIAIHAIHGLVLQRLSLNQGMHVADIGCGPGRLTVRIAREVGPTGAVVAMDVNPRALRAAERYAKAVGLRNVHFIQAGVGEGKLGHCQFDRAVLVAVLGEITNRRAAMAEIFQALKPGGLLSVTEVALDPHRQSAEGIQRMAEAAGFVDQARFGTQAIFTINVVRPPRSAGDGDTKPSRSEPRQACRR